jgi:hypothetical protein
MSVADVFANYSYQWTGVNVNGGVWNSLLPSNPYRTAVYFLPSVLANVVFVPKLPAQMTNPNFTPPSGVGAPYSALLTGFSWPVFGPISCNDWWCFPTTSGTVWCFEELQISDTCTKQPQPVSTVQSQRNQTMLDQLVNLVATLGKPITDV